MIVFNKPYIVGNEFDFISDAIDNGKLSGNGKYTKLCQDFFETNYGFKKTLLTTSCTDALEMCAMLIDIQPGDEVIVPSYTFVSTALAFVRQGAKIIFADSCSINPNLDVTKVASLITSKTKAIVPVHYAGVAVEMDALMQLAKKHGIYVIEDAAQAIDSYYKGIALGTIGHLSAFSFHETKNIIAGEGGLLGINDKQFIERAEVIWEKGTNRASFFRGEVNKYGWEDIGSSFLPSECTAAFLFAQLEKLENIQNRRKYIWNRYFKTFQSLNGLVKLPNIPDYATNNAHMFYLVFKNLDERTAFLNHSKSNEILSVFHYLSLHKSSYYEAHNTERPILKNCDVFADTLVRLPLYYDMTEDEINAVISMVKEFFKR